MADLSALALLLGLLKGDSAPRSGPPGPPGPGPSPGPSPSPSPGPAPAPGPNAGPFPSPAPAPAPGPTPGPAPAPWPSPAPASLPPFPGPGWVYDEPVSPAVAARAAYWNPLLWNYASKMIARPFVSEQFGGRWLTFKAAWHPGDKGPQTYMSTEAYRLASAAPIIAPTPPPMPPVAPPPAAAPQAPAAPGAPPHPSPIAQPSPPRAAPATPAAYAPAVVAPMTPPAVALTAKQIQHGLNQLAPSPPNIPFPLTEDGNLGAFLTPAQVTQALAGTLDLKTGHHSRYAITLYQHAKGLRTDSDAGPQTQANLLADLAAAGKDAGPP